MRGVKVLWNWTDVVALRIVMVMCAVICAIVFCGAKYCITIYGADYGSETKNTRDYYATSKTKMEAYDGYDYSDIEDSINKVEDFELEQSFEGLVKEIVNGESGLENSNNGILDNFFQELLDAIFGVVVANKNAVLQIVLLAVLSAAINSFLPSLNKGQVSEYAHMIIEIVLITILAASFFSACNECVKVIETCVDIYKAIIPVFFSAVMVTTGNATVAAYYEVVLMMMTVVNSFYKNVFVGLVKMYFLLIVCDLVTGKEQFSKLCELFESVVKLGCKTTIAIFAGLGGLKGMINPMNDVLKKNVVMKGLKLVPVVGSTVDTVSGTIVGAGTIIKNGIGLAGIIVLISVCMIPVIKLVSISVLFKVTAAVIEPIAGKKVVKVVNGTSVAVGLLTLINIVVLTLFILMLAIMCVATNVGV